MRHLFHVHLIGYLFVFSSSIQAQLNSTNGGVFTPKGTLRALIVFVSYKDASASNPLFFNKENDLPDWNVDEKNDLPSFIDPATGSTWPYIFNKDSDFEQYLDSVNSNFSKILYEMSGGKFKFMGDVFRDPQGKPVIINVNPDKGYSWSQMNERAIEEMNRINPDFDLSPFDQRANGPNFKFDNSDTTQYKPDNILDFVVFVHRYSKQWRQHPTRGMRSWVGSGGGYAGTGISSRFKLNGYRVSQGFTMTYNSGVFIHEVAHVLFNAPHIMGVNNVIGDKFYLMSAGWGIMAPISIFSGFNAWERWYSGFTDIEHDIKVPSDRSVSQFFTLGDYYTEGACARIEIPFSGGQYLWLENHMKIHPLDEHPWKGKDLGHGDKLPGSAKGVYVYIEDIASSHNEIFSPLSNRANGIKVLHAGGNYDFEIDESLPIVKNAWGNKMKSIRRGLENSISGINSFYRLPYDENKDGIIRLDHNYNSSKTEWMVPVYREEVLPDSFVNTYGAFGVYDAEKVKGYADPVPFRAGQYLDLSSNPKPLNYPSYNANQKELNPYYLNGLGLKFTHVDHSDRVQVEVRYNRTSLCKDDRWTGTIRLPNITGDSHADLIISSCVKLVMDRTGTPNTHVKTASYGFTNPSSLTIESGSSMVLRSGATFILKDQSTLVIEKGGKLVLEGKSKILLKGGSRIENLGGELEISKRAKIKEIQPI